MFEGLQEKLEKTFRWITGYGRLNSKNIEDALRDVRTSLLEADVHYTVVENLLTSVKAKALGQEVLESFTPGQQFIKVLRDEIVALLGEAVELSFSGPSPLVYMLIGLQGSGKTTTAAKLAGYLREKKRRHPCLVPADLKRYAAVEQLKVLGESIGVPCILPRQNEEVLDFVSRVRNEAQNKACDTIIVDTAGRLHCDREMMDEIKEIKGTVRPQETFLVLDAMAGQDSVRVAGEFLTGVGFDGAIMTKADGDARGGAALSLRAVTGKPIMFLGVGERTDALEVFYPDRMVSRIMGMGDVLSLIEKAEARIEDKERLRAEEVIRKGNLTLDDFLDQLKMVKKMGSFGDILSMVPGVSQLLGDPRKLQGQIRAAEEDLKKAEAIINSMTMKEKTHPEILNGSRRLRISKGSGTTIQDVNRVMKKFVQARKLMKHVGKMGQRGLGMGLGGFSGYPPGADGGRFRGH